MDDTLSDNALVSEDCNFNQRPLKVAKIPTAGEPDNSSQDANATITE